jgi:Bacterial Ig-like domain (group 2)/Calx-beta domain
MSFSKRSRILAGATLLLLGATALPANAQQDQRRPRPSEPTISIGDASIVEGNSGRQNLTFTVTLSEPSNRQVRADWRTRTGTANNRDFRADDGTVRFRNGATTATISVAINGDTAVEPDETFTVVLRDPDRATVADATAIGTIMNDDGVAVVTLSSIAITPAGPITLIKGSTAQFTALGSYSDGTTADVSSQVSWASSGAAVGVNSAGLATAKSVGTSSVTATIGSVTSAGTGVTVSPATLLSIAVTPAEATVVAGLTQQFVATGSYSDGTTAAIAEPTWSALPTAAATVTPAGLAKGVSAGTASVTASVNDVTSLAATLTVTAATVVSVAITKGLETYDNTQYTATATYTDGSVSTNATWTSSDTGIGSITAAGQFNKGAIGTTTLTATIGGVSKTLAVGVDKRITGITVIPETATIPNGKTQQLVLSAQINDGTSLPITTGATFASDGAAATVSNSGLVTAKSSEGSAIVTSSFPASYPPSGSITGLPFQRLFTATTNIITTPAVATAVTAIATTFTGSVVPGGVPVQYAATGTFSDGTTGDVTSLVTWSSNNAPVVAGLFKGNNPSTEAPSTELPVVVTATLGTSTATANIGVLNNIVSVAIKSKYSTANPPTSDADVAAFKTIVVGTLVNGQTIDAMSLVYFQQLGSDYLNWVVSQSGPTKGEFYRTAAPTSNSSGVFSMYARIQGMSLASDNREFFVQEPAKLSFVAPYDAVISGTTNTALLLGLPARVLAGNSPGRYGCCASLNSPYGPQTFGYQPTISFTSDNPSVATIVNGSDLLSVAPGTATIRATVAVPYTNSVRSVQVVVTVKAITALTMDLPTTVFPGRQVLVARTMATLDGGGLTSDVTYLSRGTWTSSDLGAINFNVSNPGYLYGQNPRSPITISATVLGFTASRVLTTVDFLAYTAAGPVPGWLVCSPNGVRLIAPLLDGTTADISDILGVSFSSSNPAVLVSNVWGSMGRITSTGPANITAKYYQTLYDGITVTYADITTAPLAYPCAPPQPN